MSKRRSIKGSKIFQKGGLEPNNGSKRRSKGVKNLTIDRVWVKMEVKMGQKSYQKGGLTKNGSKRRSKSGSKRVKDQRELLMF